MTDNNNEPSPWSDTPPVEFGYHYLFDEDFEEGQIAYFNPESGKWWYEDEIECKTKYISGLKFGPRIPSAEELVELERKAVLWDETQRAWGVVK